MGKSMRIYAVDDKLACCVSPPIEHGLLTGDESDVYAWIGPAVRDGYKFEFPKDDEPDHLSPKQKTRVDELIDLERERAKTMSDGV